MTAFSDYITPETIASIRAKMKGYAVAAQLKITDWVAGGVSQQILEAVDQALYNAAQSVSSLVRGYASLDTSTDPGDVDPYDSSNAGLTAAPGYLSAKGSGDYGTPRQDATFATGTITITNASGALITFAQDTLTFTRDSNFSGESYAPTYRNSADVTIYTGAGNTVSIANGATLDVPITAEQIGTGSNATAGHVTLTTVLAPTGVSATNAAAILGTDRQAAEDYRAACREAAALTSPNGPGDAYRYLAVTARDDGTWGSSTTGTALGVTRTYVSQQSATGIVVVYIAGAAGGTAITSALSTVSTIITTDPGVIACPTGVTLSVSLATDVSIALHYTVKMPASKVPGGATAGTYATPWVASAVYAVGQKVQNDTAKIYICTVAGTAAGSGGPTGAGAGIVDGGVTWDYSAAATGANTANTRAVFTAIATQETSYLAGVEIGGVDQTAGAGVIWTTDLQDQIVQATVNNVALGLYKPAVTIPAGASTAITLGHVATLGTVTGVLTLV